jgi:hypothetical protein
MKRKIKLTLFYNGEGYRVTSPMTVEEIFSSRAIKLCNINTGERLLMSQSLMTQKVAGGEVVFIRNQKEVIR